MGLGLLKKANDLRVRPKRLAVEPDRRLSTPCREVTDFSPEGQARLRTVAHVMVKTLYAQPGGSRLGISANQCGYDLRVAIILGDFYVNPRFVPSKAPMRTIIEGCYSVPGRRFEVTRPPYGWLHYQTVEGERKEIKLNDMRAHVAQHEVDHLDGKLCSESGIEIIQ